MARVRVCLDIETPLAAEAAIDAMTTAATKAQAEIEQTLAAALTISGEAGAGVAAAAGGEPTVRVTDLHVSAP